MRRVIVAILVLGALVGACGGDDESPGPPPADGFDAERAFQDLEAQVEIGPRPAGSPAQPRGSTADRGRGSARRAPRSVRDPASLEKRPRQRSRGRATGSWSWAPTTTPRTTSARASRAPTTGHPASRSCWSWHGCSLPRLRLTVPRSNSRSSTLRRRGGIATSRWTGPAVAASTWSTQRPAGRARRRSRRSRRWSCSTWSATATCRSRARQTRIPDLYAELETAADEAGGAAAPFGGEAPSVLDDHVPFARGRNPGTST